MSYNPVRARDFTRTKPRRPPPDGRAGTTHSDIMRRAGSVVGADANRVPSGWASTVHACDEFTVRRELIRAGYSTGMLRHPTGHRVVHVLSGLVFVEERDEENETGASMKVRAGSSVTFPPGMAYAIATSGTAEAQVLVVETKDYARGVEVIEPPTLSERSPGVVLRGDPTTSPPRDSTRAKAQALDIAARRSARQRTQQGRRPAAAAKQNANSSSVVGVNPRPMGPTDFGE